MHQTNPLGIEITSYHLRLGGSRAVLELNTGSRGGAAGETPLARFDFRAGATPLAFVNRGGFMSVTRPLDLLAATMDMLRHDSPVFLDENGTLTSYEQMATATALRSTVSNF